jgi:hypothetical protein
MSQKIHLKLPLEVQIISNNLKPPGIEFTLKAPISFSVSFSLVSRKLRASQNFDTKLLPSFSLVQMGFG